ncbi:MAG: hypothetical protein GXO78_04135 [Calditrichaeota bacterium]|nr:hypothetical protein [Calditrichota bacterium]
MNRNMYNLACFLLVAGLIGLLGCNQGLSPEAAGPSITGISGTIYFKNWPPADSLFDLRLVVFKTFPPENIVEAVVNQEAFAYPPITQKEGLPLNVQQTDYLMELPPGRYEYIVVAWQYGPNVFSDWRAAGQYDTDEDPNPTAVDIQEGELLTNIDIDVDFENLPPSPF